MNKTQTCTLEYLLLSYIFIGRKPEPKNIAAKIQQYEIDALARAFLPAISAFFQTEEGQREFAEWKANRDKQKS